MKITLLPLLASLLLLIACQKPSDPVPAPTNQQETLCFPVSITSSNDAGINENFYYDRDDRFGDLFMHEYFTRTDTVHHFEVFRNKDKDRIGLIERRDHSPADSVKDYVTIDNMWHDFLPIRRNERPYYPLNNWLINAYEIYKYTPSYVLAEQQFYKDYKLTGTRKYNYGTDLETHIEEYDAAGVKTRSIELRFDDKRHPQANNVKYQRILVGPGYPHAHNIEQFIVRNGAGVIIENESYNNAFTYNEHGYPMQVVRNYLDGTTNTYTYTYKCQ